MLNGRAPCPSMTSQRLFIFPQLVRLRPRGILFYLVSALIVASLTWQSGATVWRLGDRNHCQKPELGIEK